MPIRTDTTYAVAPDNPNAAIWRYIDFPKLVDMLERRTLYFSLMSVLEDPFEGVASEAAIRNLKDRHKEMLRWRELLPPEHAKEVNDFPVWTPENFPAMFDEHGDPRVPRMDLMFRTMAYVNCWHINEAESMAMWRLYSNDAIAIRSTYQRLFASLNPDPREMFIGKVVYRDRRDPAQAEEALNFFESMMRKGMSYEHERELRALFLHDARPEGKFEFSFEEAEQTQPKGIHIPVDLDMLIDAVYAAPGRPDWFKELVARVVKKYGLSKGTIVSSLDERPNLT